MWPVREVLSSLTLFVLLAGCAEPHSTVIEPSTRADCRDRMVPKQYIVKYTDRLANEMITDLEAFRLREDVEWIEPNYLIRPERSETEINRPTTAQQNARQIGADLAWKQGIFGQGIRVAVVDSGIDAKQRRLAHAFTGHDVGWNFVSDSREVIDETGHGTHIAGIIAAGHDHQNSHNSQFGIAPEASLIAADFMDDQPGDEYRAVRAIEYSIQQGAKIINNSWSNFCSLTLQAAFESWQENNVVFVNAAGNEGENIDSVKIYPSSLRLKNSITVGSVDERGERSSFSNFGRNVMVFAPGEGILSLVPNRTWLASRSGTSMSTAYVSGALALVWSAKPELKAAELIQKVREVAQESPAPWTIHIPTLLRRLSPVP